MQRPTLNDYCTLRELCKRAAHLAAHCAPLSEASSRELDRLRDWAGVEYDPTNHCWRVYDYDPARDYFGRDHGTRVPDPTNPEAPDRA